MYQSFYPNQQPRLWLPLLAGAAIISAPFWLSGRNNCCNNNYGYGPYQSVPYPQSYPYPYPQPIPYPLAYPYPYPINRN